MSNGTTAAIIPARGGSKGIPGKNITMLAGKPLIAWTIEAARSATAIDRIIVSTDSQAIADVAKEYGAEVPFLRPSELGRDETPGAPPIAHALRWLAHHQNYEPELTLCLQPTSPLRLASDIENAHLLFRDSVAEAVVGLTLAAQHPYWMKKKGSDGLIEPFIGGENSKLRRQDLPEVFAVNGAIYLVRSDLFLIGESFYPPKTYGYVMPPERSIDIDSMLDMAMAEYFIQQRGE